MPLTQFSYLGIEPVPSIIRGMSDQLNVRWPLLRDVEMDVLAELAWPPHCARGDMFILGRLSAKYLTNFVDVSADDADLYFTTITFHDDV